ncbi:hypothetical protein AG1IA_08119 [Rhizoctonia solani AG-1 IA]|uniref:Uncharacterized protein n=1 Tax=Thanatephorus cucumeris (strain AG1-IA) TaxID=983506 RepID=L8WI32_THACA|nr:hypothetical protein AG1IA_08119 [Rhizoctonia solani AG-1 IA]
MIASKMQNIRNGDAGLRAICRGTGTENRSCVMHDLYFVPALDR